MGVTFFSPVTSISGSVTANIDFDINNTIVNDTGVTNVNFPQTALTSVRTYTAPANKKTYITDVMIMRHPGDGDQRDQYAFTGSIGNCGTLAFYYNGTLIGGGMVTHHRFGTPIVLNAGDTFEIKLCPGASSTQPTVNFDWFIRGFARSV